MNSLQDKLQEAIWVANSLYSRNKANGSSANMSFRHDAKIYITVSGSCLGKLDVNDFACMSITGQPEDVKKASKEFVLHQLLYQKSAEIQAVIHTHSTFATLYSCLNLNRDATDIFPAYTPYLRMKLGQITLVPYAPPGTQELFRLFADSLSAANGYLLKNHGPIVGASSIMETYFALEELEETAKISWHMRSETGIAELSR